MFMIRPGKARSLTQARCKSEQGLTFACMLRNGIEAVEVKIEEHDLILFIFTTSFIGGYGRGIETPWLPHSNASSKSNWYSSSYSR